MTYICKPKKISIYINTSRKTPAQVKALLGCDIVINGGLFDGKFKPVCHLKADGTVYAKDQYAYWGYGWNSNDIKLISDYSAYKNYICCVAMVRNGQAEKMYYNADMSGARQRTAIGLFADGRLWLYCDKSNKTPEQLQQIALNAGVQSAIMLDGGGSTQGVFPTGTVTASRIVHNYICVWEEKDGDKVSNQKIVCLDAGHGGKDVSNQSPDGAYKEHEFTLDLTLRIKPLLEKHGIKVILTRDTDKTVSLAERVKIANEAGADLLVSNHTNASGNGWNEASGLTVWTYADGATAERNIAAQLLLTRMEEAGVKLFGSKLYHKAFTVLANTNMPAILTEYGFHTNKDDVALLKSASYKDKLSKATARAICDYFGIAWQEEMLIESGKIYRVQVGVFTNKAFAEALEKQLIAEGYSTILKVEDK